MINPSYSTIMKELDIEIITLNNNPLCNSNLVNLQKNIKRWKNFGFKISHLKVLGKQENRGILLRFQDNEFWVTIFTQKQKKGVFQREITATTNKY